MLLLCAVALALPAAVAPTAAPTEDLATTPPAARTVDLIGLRASLTLEVADDAIAIAGEATLSATASGARTWALDAVGFSAVDVRSTPDGRWRYDGSRIVGAWSEPVTGPISVRITYRASPKRGISRAGDPRPEDRRARWMDRHRHR